MSVNIPPNPNIDTFNNLYWGDNNETLTITEADARYLRFPIAQGTENLQAVNVNGAADFNSTVNVDGASTFNSAVNVNNSRIVLTKNTNFFTIGVGGSVNSSFTNILIGKSTIPDSANSATGGNIAIGQGTLGNLTSGSTNTAIGSSALLNNTTGADNTAYGSNALLNNLTGLNNIAVGNRALQNLTSGDNNIFVGTNTTLLTNGSNNTAIGGDISNGLTYATAIGQGAICPTSNTIQLGRATDNVNCPNTLSVSNGISGINNTTIPINAIGTGDLELRTNGVTRAVFTDTGEFIADTKGLYIQGTSGTDGQVRVGLNTGAITQGNGSVMVGGGTLGISQGTNSIAIGQGAGQSQVNNCIAIGNGAGIGQSTTAIAIGLNAGAGSQSAGTVAIGSNAGTTTQAGAAVAIGLNAGKSQAANSIAIGNGSATTGTQATNSIAIGNGAGATTQLTESIAIGLDAGKTSQSTSYSTLGDGSIAIGTEAGLNTQNYRSVAIGGLAGRTSQVDNCVAIGYSAGNLNQAQASIGIGVNAGKNNQQSQAIAIGSTAGETSQKSGSVFIGANAGNAGGGLRSIYIGSNCGTTCTLQDTIMLNASITPLNPVTNQGFYVKPIRGRAATTPVMVYDASTGEITYNNSSIKYKKNVIDLTADTSVLHNLRAREYDSKDDNSHHVGYIAEEVDAVDTNFSWKNPDGSPEGLEWFNMLVYAIEEIKKLRIEVNQLKGL